MSEEPRRNDDREKRADLSPGSEEFPKAQATAAGLLPPHVGMGFCENARHSHPSPSGAIRKLGAEKRQAEFHLGRQCGERALQEAGWRPSQDGHLEGEIMGGGDATATSAVIGVGSDGCPQWPQGFVGSISHSQHWVWAVAAPQQHYRGIGVDTEAIVSPELYETLHSEIGTEREWQLLDALGLPVSLQFTLLFSAKEAYFKLWYPLTGHFLNFEDVQLQGVFEMPAVARSGVLNEAAHGAAQPAAHGTARPGITFILECKQIVLEGEPTLSEWTRTEVVGSWSTRDVMTLTWLANKTPA